MQVYADNAATERMRDAALDAYVAAAKEYYGNPSSLHDCGQQAQEALTACRARLANLLGCLPREILFTSGGSEADNQAILSAAKFGARKGKTKILTSAIEHHAVLHPLEALQKEGFEVVLLPVSESGILSPETVADALDEHVCLVSVMTANNEIGTLQPVSEIGALCKERGVLFHTDAVQAVGHIPLDFRALNADYLSLSAHKFGGPRGIGALVVRTGAPVSPLIAGGAQEKGKRAGTENLPAIAGMTAALTEAIETLPATMQTVSALRDRLIAGLRKIPHSALNGDETNRLCGNVSFCFEGIEGESLLLYLSDLGVSASSGSACTSGSLDPSHVLLAIGRVHDVAHGSLRLTLNEKNTQEEVDHLIRSVTEVVAKIRAMSPVWRDLQAGKRQYIL
ncbi:MAG: aminotransferase class V-fold PLP-dependent enzyme [Clostridia bacterium]|nr:aminotransferase class V-fold PLP-dependent enzyme [Clostridia bacterium]